jgi:hypothetical protein
LRLQAFEPAYALPEYRADERLDGTFALPESGWAPLDVASLAQVEPVLQREPDASGEPDADAARAARVRPQLARALEEVVAPWVAQSGGTLDVATAATLDDAVRAVLARHGLTTTAGVQRRELAVDELLGLLAFAGASGGVHGRRRGGAAGRAVAWWVVRCATGLDGTGHGGTGHGGAGHGGWDPDELSDELEFRLEDLVRHALRVPGEAAWRLEVAIGTDPATVDGSAEQDVEWGAAILAFDHDDATDDRGGSR